MCVRFSMRWPRRTRWPHSTWCGFPTSPCSSLQTRKTNEKTSIVAHRGGEQHPKINTYRPWQCPSSRSWLCGAQRRSSAWSYSSLGQIRERLYNKHTLTFTHTSATNKLDVLEAHVIEHRDLLTYVFECPTLFHQVSEWMLHYTGRPLVDFTLVIICSTDDAFNALRLNQ